MESIPFEDSKAGWYRDKAGALRTAAYETRYEPVRIELLTLADNYDALARRAETIGASLAQASLIIDEATFSPDDERTRAAPLARCKRMLAAKGGRAAAALDGALRNALARLAADLPSEIARLRAYFRDDGRRIARSVGAETRAAYGRARSAAAPLAHALASRSQSGVSAARRYLRAKARRRSPK